DAVTIAKPATKPARPFFSSGPCAKPPGWDASKLASESLGRSHRAKIGKTRLQICIDLMRELLQLPATHHIGIVPGSDTGAVERLENYTPAWPLPKVFRLVSKGKLAEGVFKGETINTPSMLAVEDAIFALEWAKGLGGLNGLIARSDANAAALDKIVAKRDWL